MKTRWIAVLLCGAVLCACSGNGVGNVTTHTDGNTLHRPQEAISGTPHRVDAEVIRLDGTGASSDAQAVQISGSTVTLTAGGTYLVSGTLEDGMIVVDAGKDDQVEIMLNGVDMRSVCNAPIYIRRAGQTILSLVDGSVNLLSNGGSFVDSKIDAVIFARDNLELCGGGTLIIHSPAGHGIVARDNLRVVSGNYHITAASHGMTARDQLDVDGGVLVIAAGKDGLHAETADDASQGNLSVSAGTIRVTADGDGLSAGGTLTITDGEFDLSCGKGSANAAAQADISAKGMKSTGEMVLSGGTYRLNTADDALHSNAGLTISGGSYTIATGDDGVHADLNLTISGGEITIRESCEGLEGGSVEITGGSIDVRALDDGINASGKASSNPAYLRISGGTVVICADGDGVDSNGSLTISGGEVYISGPTTNQDGALDYETGASISGGVVIAAGSSGMAVNFDASSTQGAIMLDTGDQAAGSMIQLSDQAGRVMASYRAEKCFSNVVISCPAVTVGGTYTVTAGSFSQTVTLAQLIYSEGGMRSRFPHA